eukprot:scaffold42286_cov51-Attheya_sp.AAC.9
MCFSRPHWIRSMSCSCRQRGVLQHVIIQSRPAEGQTDGQRTDGGTMLPFTLRHRTDTDP